MTGHWCPGEKCQTKIGDDVAVCAECAKGLDKYLELNLGTLRRLAAPALEDLDRLLSAWAAFRQWEAEHPTEEET